MAAEQIVVTDPASGHRWRLDYLRRCFDLELEWAWSGGSSEATWKMQLGPDFTHPALRRGRLVEAQIGNAATWVGVLTEPDVGQDGTWSLRAEGAAAPGRRRLCLDALGNATTTPDVAIDQAIARGLPWRRLTSLSAVPFAASDETIALNRLGDLLDAWAEQEGKRWGIGTDWSIYAATDPTTPTWHMTPGSGTVGLADDDYASDLYVRYQVDALTYATVHAGDAAAAARWGTEEEPVDATRRGLMTSGDATLLASGLLALGAARLAWTAPVEPASRQITRGGVPAFLSFIQPGQMVRLHGIPDPVTGRPDTDFVIGRIRYAPGSDQIQLAPTELAARNLRDAMEKMVTTWNPGSAA